jgi:hypothetical protein
MGNIHNSQSAESSTERLINMYKRESLHKQILEISSCMLSKIIRDCKDKHKLELIPKYMRLIQERQISLIEMHTSVKYTDDEFRKMYDEIIVNSFDDIFEQYLKEID